MDCFIEKYQPNRIEAWLSRKDQVTLPLEDLMTVEKPELETLDDSKS